MYKNRQEAGRKLARVLKKYRTKDVVVLALPRGGIVLGDEVAKELNAPLDVVLVRKIGHPFSPEYAVGAVVLGQEPVVSEGEPVDEAWLKRAVAGEQQVNENRRELYYGDEYEPVPLEGKAAIIVDDGIATGLTMKAAVQAAQKQGAQRVIVAVPVAPSDSVAQLETLTDEVVVLDNPEEFLGAVGSHYQEFNQVDDDEVRSILREHRKEKDYRRNGRA